MPGHEYDEVPDYVAEYLLKRSLHMLPKEVMEVLVSLSPEQIEGLERVGKAFDAAETPHHIRVFGVH
jgi:hypothetical protein